MEGHVRGRINYGRLTANYLSKEDRVEHLELRELYECVILAMRKVLKVTTPVNSPVALMEKKTNEQKIESCNKIGLL